MTKRFQYVVLRLRQIGPPVSRQLYPWYSRRMLETAPRKGSDTRERILRIMEDVGFVPSITASGLAGGRSRLIGILVPSFTWPLIPDIVRGVAEVGHRRQDPAAVA